MGSLGFRFQVLGCWAPETPMPNPVDDQASQSAVRGIEHEAGWVWKPDSVDLTAVDDHSSMGVVAVDGRRTVLGIEWM